MARRYRSRAGLTQGVWVIAVVAIVAVVAWQLGWIPDEALGPLAARRPQVTVEEIAVAPPGPVELDPTFAIPNAGSEPEVAADEGFRNYGLDVEEDESLPTQSSVEASEGVSFADAVEPAVEFSEETIETTSGEAIETPAAANPFAETDAASRFGSDEPAPIVEETATAVPQSALSEQRQAPEIGEFTPAQGSARKRTVSRSGGGISTAQYEWTNADEVEQDGGIVQTAAEEEVTLPAAEPAIEEFAPVEGSPADPQAFPAVEPAQPLPSAVSIPEEPAAILARLRELSSQYWKNPAERPAIQAELDALANAVYFSPQPHFMTPYTVRSGDLLANVARGYKVPWQYLAALNKINPQRIREGQQLKVIKGPFAALVDLSDFELSLYAHGYFVRKYPVGIGKDGSSPKGKFTVQDKVENPQYTDPNGVVIQGDDPTNPLGEYWLDLGNSYGIHGTIEPDSIGKAESRGCIRMLDAHISEVYHMLSLGSEVIIQQ